MKFVVKWFLLCFLRFVVFVRIVCRIEHGKRGNINCQSFPFCFLLNNSLLFIDFRSVCSKVGRLGKLKIITIKNNNNIKNKKKSSQKGRASKHKKLLPWIQMESSLFKDWCLIRFNFVEKKQRNRSMLGRNTKISYEMMGNAR